MYLVKKQPLKLLMILALTLAAWSAQAQNSVIPYQGTLFSQGKPVSQTDDVKMAFAIYSDDTGLTAGPFPTAPSGDARKWTSWDSTAQGGDRVDAGKTVGIPVRNGRFLSHLGETSRGQQALSDAVFDEETLYVVTWIVNDDDVVYRLPPQALRTVPHAVTAKRAVHFEVTGTLGVDTIAPRTAEGSVQIQGPLQVSGNLQVTSLSSESGTVQINDRFLVDEQRLNVARSICYAAVSRSSISQHMRVIIIPLPSYLSNLDAVCHETVNDGWNAGGVAKANSHDQNCSPIDNLNYGGGYTSYSPEAYFEGNRSYFTNCNSNNAFICCSPEFPN